MAVNARRSSSDTSVAPALRYKVEDVVPAFVPDVDKLTEVNMINIKDAPRPVVEFQFGWTSKSKDALKAWDKFYASSFTDNDKVKCDGRCGNEFDQNDIVQFGCDHNVCKDCLPTVNGGKNFDGSPGCSRCAMTMSRSPSFSAISSVPTSALRDSKVRLVIISRAKDITVRFKEFIDMRGCDDLSLVQGRVEQLVKDIEKSKMYFTLKLKFHRRDLIPVEQLYGNLSSYAKPGQMMTVVVVTREIRIILQPFVDRNPFL